MYFSRRKLLAPSTLPIPANRSSCGSRPCHVPKLRSDRPRACGEYAAINSAIQELIPARFRGRTDLAINGSYWFGAAAGAGVTVFLLDPRLFPPEIGWRVAFGTGAVLGLGILLLRRFLPWRCSRRRGDRG